MRGCSVCILLLCLAEALVVIYLDATGTQEDIGRLWIELSLRPAAHYVAILAAMYLLSRYFSRKKQLAAQALVIVLAISMICFIVACVHHDNIAVSAAFVFPIFVSLMFIDFKPLVCAFVLSLSGYLVYSILVLPARANGGDTPDAMEIGGYVILLCISFCASAGILKMLWTLVDAILHRDEQLKRDPFTRLYNHTSFFEHLDRMVAEGKDDGTQFSLVIWDIDDFKRINDRYGHDTGDRVIECFAAALRKVAVQGELGFRYGGEEFTALTPGEPRRAIALACAVRETFSVLSARLLEDGPATACAGVCTYDSALFDHRESFFSAADVALYAAKAIHGKNACRVWKPGIRGAVATCEESAALS